MRIALLNTVLLAEDYARLRDWWIEVVGLEKLAEWTTKFHYAELGWGGRYVVGIADAKEMGVTPESPRRNTAMPQLSVDDVPGFFTRLRERGATVHFGPSWSEDEGGFWYGSFVDVEGNEVWVVSLTGPASERSA